MTFEDQLQHQILQALSKKSPMTLAELKSALPKYGDKVYNVAHKMVNDGCIHKSDNTSVYSITAPGSLKLKMLNTQNNTDKFRFWFPVVLSLLAIAIAFYSLYLQARGSQ